MTNTVTFKIIATQQAVSDRTVRRWYDAAKAEKGDFGTLTGNTRTFSPEEAEVILSYAPSTHVAKRITPIVTIELCDSDIVTPNRDIDTDTVTLTMTPAPIVSVPTVFDFSRLRGGLVQGPIVDSSQTQTALAVMDQLSAAMDLDIQRQQTELQQSQQLAQQVKAKAQQLQQQQTIYQLRSELNTALQSQQQAEVSAALGKLDSYAQSS
jgi:hypothetical protein